MLKIVVFEIAAAGATHGAKKKMSSCACRRIYIHRWILMVEEYDNGSKVLCSKIV